MPGDVARAPPARHVLLERLPARVEAVAEQLDRHAELRPVAADLVALAVDVRARQREAMGREQPEEGVLEERERDVGSERAAEIPGARLARVARDARLDPVGPAFMANPGLVAQARERLLGGRPREVE